MSGTKSEQRDRYVVIRNADGSIRTKFVGDVKKKRQTAREYARSVTNNAFDQIDIINALSKSIPVIVKLPDGREHEPIVPTPSQSFAASQFMVEFIHGKATSQLEVMRAEEEAQNIAQVQALSDQELKQQILESFETRKLEDGEPDDD